MAPPAGVLDELAHVERDLVELYSHAIRDIGEGKPLPDLKRYKEQHERFAAELEGYGGEPTPEGHRCTFVERYIERLQGGASRSDALSVLAASERDAERRYERTRAEMDDEAILESIDSHREAGRQRAQALERLAEEPAMRTGTAGGAFSF